MTKTHQYKTYTVWTDNNGNSTKSYKSYSRNHVILADSKPDILASADPAFRGDPSRYNPEEMLVAATSSCHMLWYLHFCAVNGVQVLSYADTAEGAMTEGEGNGGYFTAITLRPAITISADSDIEIAMKLHKDAAKECFIANSLKCPVTHAPIIKKAE
ncbi:OsmC family protein [Kordiimonas pumila]|uniref:OsmC family protein n=1 Tax=Kordiimonas pumila TaxID=2161677 RepID=A0ABV7D700_9PROT|nr:OsmC family protein [Kordiimonas pumila]